MLFDVDDGPGTLEESVEMARIATTDGIRVAVSTPHVRSRADAEVELFAERAAALNRKLREERIFLLVLTGAEVTAVAATELDDELLRHLTLGDSRTILVEPPEQEFRILDEAIFSLQLRGFRTAIAHPERCKVFQNDPDLLQHVAARGAINFVTAGSFTGAFGRKARKLANQMARNHMVDVICSDAHDIKKRRPEISKAAKSVPGVSGLVGGFERLTSTTPGEILSERL